MKEGGQWGAQGFLRSRLVVSHLTWGARLLEGCRAVTSGMRVAHADAPSTAEGRQEGVT